LKDPAYVVGIDLGTTNTVVAYTKTDIGIYEKPEIFVLEIQQVVKPGIVEKRNVLPSYILVSGKHDVEEKSLSLPWGEDNKNAVGVFARERGAEIPHRLISSSKSWLCNDMVDRNKPVLPWESYEDVPKISPVEASACILKHIHDMWNHSIAANDDEKRIENQDILLTVPASFDAIARDLTVKAANMAGLNNITLLEEPQAAFYAWIESLDDKWRRKIKKGDLVLVCDIGGGTSDFSLINVSEKDGDLDLERIAVGNHLLVGGDNMDLALAYSIHRKMALKGKKLDSWQMRGLWYNCRRAKENLLVDPDSNEYPVTILGRGSSLIGGTIKTSLSKKDVNQIVLDGFFAKCDKNSKPASIKKVGLKEVGLSYEAEPSITRHLAHFLSVQKVKDGQSDLFPTAVLFNGGLMKARSIRDRIMEVVNSWADECGFTPIREIEANDYDLSVAKGAAYYGLARRGNGVRIRGGIAKSYYIGVEASMPAIPGMPAPLRALCIAPFGMEEGTKSKLADQEFALVLGEEVKFELLCSSIRKQDKLGMIIDDWEGEVDEITSMETVLGGEVGKTIYVSLEVNVTEVGTLELWCASAEDSRRWKLEFNVRERQSLE